MVTLQELLAKKKAELKQLADAEGESQTANFKMQPIAEVTKTAIANTIAKTIEMPIVPKKKLTLKELIALRSQTTEEKQEDVEENLKPFIPAQEQSEETAIVVAEEEYTGAFSLSIQLNDKQLLAKDLASQGKSFCLIGAAGTGKTTAQREIAKSLLEQGKLGTHNFRIQGTGEYCTAPSIAFVAYTRIAAGNLRRAIHKDQALEETFQHNITTIHNLLEYVPETYWNYELNKECFRFVPRRNAGNPLDITHLVIEESSMVGVADIWPKLFEALRPGVQIIFIGDINQLPPVFGSSILNYALVQLPIVELTKVYRQKDGSSVLDNAHKILKGETDLIWDNKCVAIEGGTVQHGQAKLAASLRPTFEKWFNAEAYDPEQDIILCPWNKHDLGTDSINNIIAQMLGVKRDAVVFEVICGMTKRYLAVGDRVLYNKQVGTITGIRHNAQYYGKAPKSPSNTLTRFGTYSGKGSKDELDEEDFALDYSNLDIEEILDEKGEKKQQASHTVEIEMETGITEFLSAVGDFSPQSFSLGYALTVHKAQGCEWRKVFLILHKDHAISAYRELIYTAWTRARENVIYIGKKFMLEKAIKNPRIKGNTIAEKIEYFNGGTLKQDDVYCTK